MLFNLTRVRTHTNTIVIRSVMVGTSDDEGGRKRRSGTRWASV